MSMGFSVSMSEVVCCKVVLWRGAVMFLFARILLLS
jgi:hypothetical protein